MKKALLVVGFCLMATCGSIAAATVDAAANFSQEMTCVGMLKAQSLRHCPDASKKVQSLAFLMNNTTFVPVAYAVHKALYEIGLKRPRLAGAVVTVLIKQLEEEVDAGARFSLRQTLVELAGTYPYHAARICVLLTEVRELMQGFRSMNDPEAASLARDIARVRVPSPPMIEVEA